MVYVPIDLVDGVAGLFNETDEGGGAVEVARALGIGVTGALVALLGAVLYAGMVSAIVSDRLGDNRQRLGDILGSLPYLRLIGADLAYTLIVAAGFLALIVPGLIFVTWFALVAPAIELEGLGVAAALRRSRELVRPHFWKVFAVAVPLFIASFAVSELVNSAIESLGESFISEWASAVVADVIVVPFLALFVVLTFIDLSGPAKPAR